MIKFMNYVYLSPHFPSNYYPFVIKLREVGVNVLGICDTPYNQLPDSLKHHLTEYYRVTDMHNYDELLRVVEYFTHHYGKIDRFESHNEYWLETEARTLEQILRNKCIPAWFGYWGQDVNPDWPWWQKELAYFLENILKWA
jgi:hypothetical protein